MLPPAAVAYTISKLSGAVIVMLVPASAVASDEQQGLDPRARKMICAFCWAMTFRMPVGGV
jgi:hypothetical protein